MAGERYRSYLPLFPLAIRQFDLGGYDFVVSSSHCVAKAVRTPPDVRHLCYCHSPMRYAWDQFDAYFGPARVGRFRSRWIYRPLLDRMARWDADTASRVDRFLANSGYVAGRIGRYYKREALVVYPPVDTGFYSPAPAPTENHFLIVSALVPYKRLDLAIAACVRVGARLRIAGGGPDRRALERVVHEQRADATVELLGPLPDEGLRDEYRRARAVLLPGEEDFGIVPVEAQACGTPVIALGRGGALETVRHEETGLLFDEPNVDSLATTLERFTEMTFDRSAIRRHAEQFSRERHVQRMRTAIDETLSAPPGRRW
jgi:glycosyltransferase involved in cell wall biosynthesis